MRITSEEVRFIKGINSPGTYNLTGAQALQYSRIRFATGGDYVRTERMRKVLVEVYNKVSKYTLVQLNSFIDFVLPKVYTNITATDIFELLPRIPTFSIKKSVGWPYKNQGIMAKAWYGIPVTLEKNVTELHKELFNETNYIPSNTVKGISEKIIKKTGIK